jgi:predicted porin
MLKKLLWCCLGIGVSDLCSAQSMQLYGLVDQGIRLNLHQSSSAGEDIQIKQGNKMGSRFGLKGREEISPSHYVFFNLEGDTYSAAPSTVFKRRNLIGYENRRLGQFTLGLQSSVAFDIARLIDPSGLIRQKYVIDDFSGTFNGRYGNKWIDQALKYSFRTPNFNLITSYQFGNAEHKTEPSLALGLSYKMGDTLVAGSYSSSNNQRVTHRDGASQIFNAGVSHQIGKANFKLGFSHSSLANPLLTRYPSHRPASLQTLQNVGIGFKYQIQAHHDFFMAAYRQKSHVSLSKTMFGNKFVIGSNYHLSKHTHLYAFLNHANGSDSGKMIKTISSATVGVVHRF